MTDTTEQDFYRAAEEFNLRWKELQTSPDALSYRTLGARIYQCILDHTCKTSAFTLQANAVIASDLSEANQATALLGILNALVETSQKNGFCVPTDEDEAYDAYGRHASTLRNWFIAYGVGGPALVATHDGLIAKISAAHTGALIAVLFLGGVGLQILSTIIYKAAAWSTMDYGSTPEQKVGLWTRVSTKITNSVLIEIITDLGTLGLFAWATILVFRAIIGDG